MSKVLITGGGGFVGSRVAKKFVDAGDQVFIYDSFKQYILPKPDDEPTNLLVRLSEIYKKIEIVQGDTLNKDYLRRVLNRIKPDIIVHMAALPLASVAIEHTEDAFDSIMVSTINIMEVMRDFTHSCRMTYISSSMVYGDFELETVAEDAKKDPKDIYGSLKLAGEIIVRGYMKRYDLKTSIVRPSAVYGPFDANQRVLYKFVSRALQGLPLQVDSDGSIKLDFTYVDDAAQGIYLVSTHPKAIGETFNITRGEAHTLQEAVEIIKKNIPGVRVESIPTPAHIPHRGTLDITKARQLLEYTPEYDLEKGLTQYIEHLRKNPI